MNSTTEARHSEQKTYEIDLLELWYRILDYWKVIFIVVVAGAALGFCISKFVMTPKYEATSKIYVLSSKDSVVNLSDLQLGTYLASDYQEVFVTREVSEKVISNLALSYTLEDLQKMMKVTNPNGTRILYITITSEDPDEAAAISNEFSSVASDYIAEVMQIDRPTSLSVAVPPEEPSSPKTLVNTIIGGAAALVISVLVIAVLLRELNAYAEEQGWKIRAVTGSEILYTESVVDYLDAGEIPTMGITNYVLVEFYPREEFKRIYDGLRKLANAGYPPILSHVERYECLRKDDPKIRDLKAFDVKFQVNAGTAIRCLEPLGDRFIRKLIKNGHVDYIASDAHNAGTRPVLMRKAYTEIEKKYGKETADRLFCNNQKKDFLKGSGELE